LSTSVRSALFGAVVGLVAFEASFGLALAHPRYIQWLMHGEDSTVHFLGWHMYRHHEWTMPLGRTVTFEYPFGASVGLTDSIPIFAFLFKAVDPLLVGDWQYIGLWLLISWLLQGVFGALLVGTATSNVVLRVLGAALFVLSPPLIFRFGHAALSAHWLLLAALWLYFAPWARQWARRSVVTWAVLVGVASSTHPYLAAMVLAVCAGFYSQAMLMRPSKWLASALLPLVALTICSGVVLWQAGYFVHGSGIRDELGLGLYSANLLAPFITGQGSVVLGDGLFATAARGQYEGYAYAGAGMLMLTPVAVTALLMRFRSSTAGRQWLSHAPLILVCALFIVFAASPRVTAGTRVLFEYPASVWGPLGVFRASGRFIWVPYYAAIAAVVCLIVRTMNARLAAALLAVAVMLQAYDLSGSYLGARGLRRLRWNGPLYSSFWSEAAPHYRHLILWPSNLCERSGLAIDYIPFALVAGRAGMTLNGGFEARQDPNRYVDYCRSFQAQRTRGDVSDDELYVMRPDFRPGFESRAQQPVTCIEVDGFAACMTTRSAASWRRPPP
jgi:hypothetical protein